MTGGPQRLNSMAKVQFLWRSYKKCGGHGEPSYGYIAEVFLYNGSNVLLFYPLLKFHEKCVG